MTDDTDSWFELVAIGDADAAMWAVVVACAQCGMRQVFRGTEHEIGDAAEVWKKGHQCVAPYWCETASLEHRDRLATRFVAAAEGR